MTILSAAVPTPSVVLPTDPDIDQLERVWIERGGSISTELQELRTFERFKAFQEPQGSVSPKGQHTSIRVVTRRDPYIAPIIASRLLLPRA